MDKLYEHSCEKVDSKSKQDQLADDRYMIMHWEQIEAKRHPNASGCSAEGYVSHVLSARLGSRPMGWSASQLEQMAGA